MPRSSSAEGLQELLADLPPELRQQVFTHASWVEHRSQSYERLAFLGDVVLSLAVSNHLYPRFERYGAGRLTKVRAQAVSGASCARVARELGGRPLLPPRRMAPAQRRHLVGSERVLASVCEAIIGAAYLSSDWNAPLPADGGLLRGGGRRGAGAHPSTTSRCCRTTRTGAPGVRLRTLGRGARARPLRSGRPRWAGELGAREVKTKKELRAGGRPAGAEDSLGHSSWFVLFSRAESRAWR